MGGGRVQVGRRERGLSGPLPVTLSKRRLSQGERASGSISLPTAWPTALLAQGWSGRELLCQGLTFSLRALLGPDVSEEGACCLPASLGEAVLGDRYPQPPANPAPRAHSSFWEVRVPGLKGRRGRPAPLEPLVLPGPAPGGATASLAAGPALHLHSPICSSSASCPHVCL